MSAGYLGKISALVTVNTTDIASKVQGGFAAPFENALRSIENSLRSTNRSVEKSFADMYTTSQKRLRAMAAAQMGAVKNFNSDDFSKRFAVSDGIATTLGKLAREVEKTSGTIRERFEPALASAQAEAQELIDRLTQKLPVSTDEIGRMAKRVDDLTRSFGAAGTAAARMERTLKDNEGLRTNLRQEQRVRANVGASSSLADRRQMLQREEIAGQNVGLRSNLRQERRLADHVGEMSSLAERRAMLAREALNGENIGLRTNLREQQRLASHVGEMSSLAERRAMLAREAFNAERVGLRTNLAQERRVAANVGASSTWAPGAREEMVRANIGASSPVSFQTPYRRGLVGPAGPITTGMSPVSIAGSGARTNLPDGYLQRVVREAAERRQRTLDESAARERDAAQRARQEDINRQREAAARFSAQAVTSRRSASDEFAGSLGGRGARGVALGLDRNALAASTAELQIIQRAIGRASAEARGPAVEAFVRLKNAISDAFENGTIDSEATRRNIARLRTEAVNSAAQVGGVSRRGLNSDVTRAGDVARGGADKFGLALQQAGYAIDDFFSATGGMDQKIRAVSNNISQLGFIVGGTAGLFAGMAVTIGSQAVVALMKWADAGRTSADRTKALNDAIQAQQSLVKGLSDAYKELAKSLSAAMSPGAQKKADRDRAFLDIGEKRLQANRENVFSSDTGVASARASVVVAEKALSGATTASGAKVAEMQVRIAKQREEQAKEEALRRTARFNDATGAGVGAGISTKAAIEIAIGKFGDMRMRNMEPEDAAKFREFIQAQQRAVPQSVDRQAAATQLRGFIENEVRTNDILRNPGAISTDIMGELFEQLARLEFALNETNGALIDDVNRSLVGTADAIDNAKNTLDKAAMETQDVSSLRTEIDRVAASLEALSLAAAETTDKDVLAAIAEDAAAAKELGDRLSGAARKAKEFADKLQEAITEENNAAARGVDLGKVRDQGAQADDIRAAAANIGNNAERNAFVARAFGNVVADTQTILKGFAQERENAILGGPSRAALNASDVSTMEGQRELNRLLRGDDPNRDVNFAEMKHQSELLQTIADRILAATGIAVEFR
jgi:hypothetical protein